MKRYFGIVAVATISGMFAAGLVQSLFSAYAVQNELVPPTSGIYTGIQFSQKVGDAFKSLASCNKGAAAPANVESATVDGQCWIDDTTSLWLDKFYVNGGWAIRGAYNASDSTYLGVIGGGVPGSVASAATTDLNSIPQANITITGTTTISGFGSSAPAGIVKLIRFNNTLTLTYSASLLIPGGYDLNTAANDRAIVTHLGSGVWEITQYTRQNGVPIDIAAVGRGEITFGDLPPLSVYGGGQALTRTSYPALVAKLTRAQNGTRTSGNATIASIGDVSGFGAGMPVEGTGINAGCTIASVGVNAITLNSSGCVVSSGTSTVTVFKTGYGSGGTSSTVGVPDCQGRTLAGRDDTIAAASRITSAISGVNGAAINAAGGLQYTTIQRPDLPNVGITFLSDIRAGLSVTLASGAIISSNVSTNNFSAGSGFTLPTTSSQSAATTQTFQVQGTTDSINGGIGQTNMRNMPPVLIGNCVVRAIP
jgi:hypothetical protein